MRGENINRELIEGIVRSSNTEYLEATEEKVQALLSLAIENLSARVPYINFDNTYLQPVNELLTGGFTDSSTLVYFLGIDNTQIELNTLRGEDNWKKIKERVVFAWKNRNPKKKKKRRSKDLAQVQEKPKNFNPANYNLFNVAEDLQQAVALNLSSTSIVYLDSKRIRILGKDDFGSNTRIVIYPVLYNGHSFKFYLDKKRGFIIIDNEARLSLLEEKVERVGYSYINMIKIFNVLFYNFNKVMPNQIFIESLLYNCPDELFSDEIYDAFVKIVNYLSMADIKDFKSNVNQDKSIFTDLLCGNSGLGFKKFISKLLDLKS